MRSIIVANSSLGIVPENVKRWLVNHRDDTTILHHGRNEVRLVKEGDKAVTVKKFSRDMKNRLLYALRHSKARKSYENAIVLLERGIATPMPLGFMEMRGSMNVLLESAYVCKYEESLTLYEAIQTYGRKCLGAFAAFVALLHDKGVRHDDLNNTNVRVKINETGNLSFSLIDLNRMKIYPDGVPVPEKECFDNICRFCCLDSDFIYFVTKYIETRNMAADKATTAICAKKRHDRIVDAEKWFKQLIKLQYI